MARFDHKAYLIYGDDPTDEQINLIKNKVYKEVQRLNPSIEIPENELQVAFSLVMNYIQSCRASRLYWQKISKPETKVKLSLNQFREMVRTNALQKTPGFTINHTNQEIYETLCRYFSDDKDSKLDPRKGLLIYGRVGCGKTFLMEAMQRNPKCSFVVRGCPEISFEYAKHGIERIDFYSNPWKTYRNEFGQTTTGICFDDLGTENERRHYGDKLDVIADILASRYRKKELWSQTFITTNLNADQILKEYGPRLASRFSEMFNLLSFPKTAIDWRTL